MFNEFRKLYRYFIYVYNVCVTKFKYSTISATSAEDSMDVSS